MSLTLSETTPVDASAPTSGRVDWTYKIPDAALDFLAEGETLTVTYPVTIVDAYGASVTQDVVITVTGTNDRPVIAADATTHGVLESTGTGEPDTAQASTTGTLAFTDVDLSDSHTVSAALLQNASWDGGTIPSDTMSALQLALTAEVKTGVVGSDSTGSGAGTVSWSFSVAQHLLDFLGDGETMTLTYDVAIDDSSVASNATSLTQTVTVVVTGTNDRPMITALDDTAGVTEDDAAPLTATGNLAFTDADLTDHETLSVQLVSALPSDGASIPDDLNEALQSALTFSQETFNSNSGNTAWNFTLDNSLVQYLGADETITVTYSVGITDDSHASNADSATQTITITIAGSNDQPAISAVDVEGAVVEDGSSPTLTDAGSVTFTDVDATDRETAAVDFVEAVGGHGGTVSDELEAALANALTLTNSAFATNSGTIEWNFTLDNSLVQYLGDGETVTATYTISVADNSGAVNATSEPQTVTITITGTNAAPIITAANTIDNLRDDDDHTPKFVLDTILFQDADSAGVVTARFSVDSLLTDGFFSYNAIEHDGVTGDVSLFGRSVTLTGTIADINAYLATGGLIFHAANTNDHTLTVAIDDGSGAPNAVTTKTITLDSHQSLQSDLSGWTIDGVSNLAFGSSNNSVVTAWNRLPSFGAATYDGGSNSAAGDTITLAFKTAQLEDILTNGGARNELQDYLDGNVGSGSSFNRTLDLSSSDWNSVIKNFEHAKLAIATGDSYVVYGAIGENLPDYKSGSTGDGNDNTLVGDASSNNVMNGQSGNDILVGRKGNDALNGGTGADLLLGGAGNDTLTGGGDNDIMAGGSGNDTFVFAPNFGHDVIVDFQHGADKIDLGIAGDFASIPTSGGTLDFAAWLANQPFEQIGDDTLIHITANDTILLKNVAATTLSANDFIVHHPPLVG